MSTCERFCRQLIKTNVSSQDYTYVASLNKTKRSKRKMTNKESIVADQLMFDAFACRQKTAHFNVHQNNIIHIFKQQSKSTLSNQNFFLLHSNFENFFLSTFTSNDTERRTGEKKNREEQIVIFTCSFFFGALFKAYREIWEWQTSNRVNVYSI